jgi:hypothetical protein
MSMGLCSTRRGKDIYCWNQPSTETTLHLSYNRPGAAGAGSRAQNIHS